MITSREIARDELEELEELELKTLEQIRSQCKDPKIAILEDNINKFGVKDGCAYWVTGEVHNGAVMHVISPYIHAGLPEDKVFKCHWDLIN